MVSVVIRGILIQLVTPERNARARERRRYAFYRHVERAWRIRIRRYGQNFRYRPGRGDRRNRRNRGHCRVRSAVSQLRKLDELPSAESVREVAVPVK